MSIKDAEQETVDCSMCQRRNLVHGVFEVVESNDSVIGLGRRIRVYFCNEDEKARFFRQSGGRFK